VRERVVAMKPATACVPCLDRRPGHKRPLSSCPHSDLSILKSPYQCVVSIRASQTFLRVLHPPDSYFYREGTQHGCGHYIVTKKLRKEDCDYQFCMNSESHPSGRCNGCGQSCKRVRSLYSRAIFISFFEVF